MKIFSYITIFFISFFLVNAKLNASPNNFNNLNTNFSNFGTYQDIVADKNHQFFNDNQKIYIANRVIIDGLLNDNFDVDNRYDKNRDSTAKIRYFNKLNLTKGFSLNSFLSLENTKKYQQNYQAQNDINLYDHGYGLRAEEFNLRYLFENKNKKIANNLIAGKFNLGYGTAWQWDRGIWIQNIARSYQQNEKLGITNLLKIGDVSKTGQYNLGLSFFTNDRKNIDNTLFSSKNTLPKSDAIPGDTRSLKSYNFSLDVNFDFKKNEKLSYHLSYLNLAVNGRNSSTNQNKIADQNSIVYAIKYQIPIQDYFKIDALLEYNKTNNYLGNSDRLQSQLTANMIINFQENWNLLYGFARLKDRNYNHLSYNRYLNEISLGYQFNANSYFDKLTTQIGYQLLRTSYLGLKNQDINAYGILIRYYKNF